MYFYFKDDSNGVGITCDKETFVGNVTWITKEEFDAIILLQEQEVQLDGNG